MWADRPNWVGAMLVLLIVILHIIIPWGRSRGLMVRIRNLRAASHDFESQKSQSWWHEGHSTLTRFWSPTKSPCCQGRKLHDLAQELVVWSINESKLLFPIWGCEVCSPDNRETLSAALPTTTIDMSGIQTLVQIVYGYKKAKGCLLGFEPMTCLQIMYSDH